MAEPSPMKKRQDARRAAGSKSKPYSKKTKIISPSSSEGSDLPLDAVETILDFSAESLPTDRPGFPTYTQYKRIENIYLASLSPRKRDKALITQTMFDNIWDVLHDPDTREVETAQFRFWVRKMFALSDPQPTQIFTAGDATTTVSSVPVVLHENRPIAIKEQLYELFVYCHGRSNHGGRDKTCAVIRQHYSWVPKELTAQFVKACPTCTLKRSGNPDWIAMVQEQGMRVNKSIAPPVDNMPITPYFGPGPNEPVVEGSQPNYIVPQQYQDQNLHAEPRTRNWSPAEGSLDCMAMPVPHRESAPMLVDAADTFDCVNAVVTPPPRPPAPPRGLKQPPAMSREVSLFNGIPHGWTVDDPESIQARAKAYNAMVDGRTGIAAMLPVGRVPRIPSVVFKQNSFFTPDSEGLLPLQRTQTDVYDLSCGDGATPPASMNGREDGTHSGHEPMFPMQADSGDMLSTPLQPLRVTNPQAIRNKFVAYVPDIDPSLLVDNETNCSRSSGGTNSGSTSDICATEALVAVPPPNDVDDTAIRGNTPNSLDFIKPTLLRRAAAPAPLELTDLQTPNFMSHRNLDDSSPTTPGSASSCYSQLSFQTSSTASTDASPPASALITPTDEHQKMVMELAEETDGLVLASKDTSDLDAMHPWEQEAEFPTMMNLAQEASGCVVC
jgi:hypothetical protein